MPRQRLNVTNNERAAYSPALLRAASALRNAGLRPHAYTLCKAPVMGKRGLFYEVMAPDGRYVHLTSIQAIIGLAREYGLWKETRETLKPASAYLSWDLWQADRTARDLAIMAAEAILAEARRALAAPGLAYSY